jgi:hypothetical protein
MIAAGINSKALSAYMGHASITITLDRYGQSRLGSRTPPTKAPAFRRNRSRTAKRFSLQ